MKKGFTLVELLAVIVILAVILVIAVPQVMKVVDQSRQKSYINQKQIILQAARQYVVENLSVIEFEDDLYATVLLSDLQAAGIFSDPLINSFGNLFHPQKTRVLVVKNNYDGYDFKIVDPYETELSSIVSDGLVLHLDASKVNLSDGDKIAIWPDFSGNSNDAIQINEIRRPIYKDNVISGKPIIRFSGSQKFFLSHEIVGMPIVDNTVFIILQGMSNSGRQRYITFSRSGSTRLSIFSESGRYEYASGGFSPRTSVSATSDVNMISGTKSGENIYLYFNGELTSSAVRENDSSPNSATIGSWSDDTQFANVDISEIIIYNRALNENERQQIESYLGAKWLGW